MLKTTKDLTKGSPVRLILSFAIPMLFGMLFQQFYGMVDTMIVGRHLGVQDLAGVGATGSINFMVIGFCCGVCSGFSIPVAQCFGAGDYRGMRRFLTNSVWIALFFSLVITVLVCRFCTDILRLMRTPEDILDISRAYIYVIFLGIPATFFYNLLAGVIRSIGDSRTPVVILIGASLINIILDLFLIEAFGLGVAGAAWATVISQLLSGLACLIYLWKKVKILHPFAEEWRFDRTIALRLCRMGIPMGLQYSITAIGSVILQTSVNTLGSAAVASMTAGSRLYCFVCCPFDALGSTMATWAGQNLGARRLDRVREGVQDAALIGVGYSLLALLFVYLFGSQGVKLFLDSSETLVSEQAVQYVRIVTLFFVPLCFVNVFRFAIQGLGYSGLAVFAGLFELVGRSLAGILLVPRFGFLGACFAGPIAWLLADAFLLPAFYWCLAKTTTLLSIRDNAQALPRMNRYGQASEKASPRFSRKKLNKRTLS